ncbi:MAG: YceI family protein [Planctomycetota bacterium]
MSNARRAAPAIPAPLISRTLRRFQLERRAQAMAQRGAGGAWQSVAAYRALALVCALAFPIGCASPAAPLNSAANDTIQDAGPGSNASDRAQLIIVLRETGSEVDRTFREREVPWLTKTAEEFDLALVTLDAATGAPAVITTTPQILYQDHRGRSIYQGRWSNHDRIVNFLRTASVVPGSFDPLTRENVFVERDGRAKVVLATKVTALTGSSTEDEEFRSVTDRAIARGLKGYSRSERIDLERSDRTFYLDFYPHRDGDTLYVSGAVFSQFDCHEPIVTHFETPESGVWSEREAVIERMAQRLADDVQAQIAAVTTGDGFDSLPTAVAVKPWEALSLPLPLAPKSAASVATGTVTLPTMWSLAAPDPKAPPQLLFKFAPPLDHYAGEVREVTSTLRFGDKHRYDTLNGSVEARAKSVTMGDPDLDDSLYDSSTLDTETHPEATFVIDRVRSPDEALEFGVAHAVELDGQFTMRGKSIPLTARATFEPSISPDGTPELRADGSFQIRLRDTFGIDGPDGPSPANDTLIFTFRFRYRAAE